MWPVRAREGHRVRAVDPKPANPDSARVIAEAAAGMWEVCKDDKGLKERAAGFDESERGGL